MFSLCVKGTGLVNYKSNCETLFIALYGENCIERFRHRHSGSFEMYAEL